jgi:excisionase family DNA binding protein
MMSTETSAQHAPTAELVPFLEVCIRLGIHRNTGYVMMAEDRFPMKVYRVGGRWKCRKAEVDKFFAAA